MKNREAEGPEKEEGAAAPRAHPRPRSSAEGAAAPRALHRPRSTAEGAAALFGAYLDGRFGGRLPRRSPGVLRGGKGKEAPAD